MSAVVPLAAVGVFSIALLKMVTQTRIIVMNMAVLAFASFDGIKKLVHDTITHNADVQIKTNGTNRFNFGAGGFAPLANDTYDLGTSSLRWQNVYTTDLQLSNEGKTNDVDGTWGDYTIQEGESDLFLINNRSGKKFKFMLQEIS